MQLIALGVDAVTGQWTAMVAPAIGAGLSVLLAALIHAGAARERLWTEKMQADVASAKFTSAMLERQHDAMVRDFARQASASEPRH